MIAAEPAVARPRARTAGRRVPVAVARARDRQLRRGDVRARGDRPAVRRRRARDRADGAAPRRSRPRATRSPARRSSSTASSSRAARRSSSARATCAPTIARYVDGEQVDKYVDGSFAAGVVYTCQVVLANPTSSRQRIAALVQIPRGSIAGRRRDADARRSTSCSSRTARTATSTRSTSRAGQRTRTSRCTSAAAARSSRLHRRARSRSTTRRRRARSAVVGARLAARQHRRCRRVPRRREPRRDRPDARRVADARPRARTTRSSRALERRRVVRRDAVGLRAAPPRPAADPRSGCARSAIAARQAGPVLDDAVRPRRRGRSATYEHLEYAPLVNARAHRLGPRLRILNDGFAAQYARFLELVAHRAEPRPPRICSPPRAYLLAQDRDEAGARARSRA